MSALLRDLLTTGVNICNLGIGIGYSVLEMIRAYDQAKGPAVPQKVVERRPGGYCPALG